MCGVYFSHTVPEQRWLTLTSELANEERNQDMDAQLMVKYADDQLSYSNKY